MGQRQQQNNNSNNNNNSTNNNNTQRVAKGNLSVRGGRGDAALSGNMINKNYRVSLFRTLQAFRPILNPNPISIYTIFIDHRLTVVLML